MAKAIKLNRDQRKRHERALQQAIKQAKRLAAGIARENDVQAISKAGLLLANNRAWDDALACFNRLEQLSPDNTDILQKKAYVLANSRHIQQAFDVYKKVLRLEPDNHGCRKNSCVLLFTTGHLDDALKLAKELESALPDNPEILYLLGEIYAKLNDKPNSCQSYQQAIIGFRKQFRHNEPDAATLIKISRCLIATKEYKKAHLCLEKVLRLTPSMPAAHYEMGQLFERIKQPVNALKAYRQCLKIKPDHYESLTAYSSLMAGKGRLDKSAWAFRRLLLQAPEDAALKHLVKASSSEKVKGGADEQYVKDVFDNYADTFENHLVNTLAYYTPEKLEHIFSNTISETKDLNTIDLGCGTGLCGPLFRPYSKQLVGIDLSSGMLEKATDKACYDELLNCDLVAGLSKFHGSLDLAIAADVFVYVGELQAVFAACYKALKPRCHLLFSVETTASRKGLVLQPSGRYQHSAAYVEGLLENNHFTLVRKETADIRNEGGKPVLGALYLVRKEAFSPLY